MVDPADGVRARVLGGTVSESLRRLYRVGCVAFDVLFAGVAVAGVVLERSFDLAAAVNVVLAAVAWWCVQRAWVLWVGAHAG